MNFKSEMIPLSKIDNNTGQIDGVPKNPRYIKDHRYQKLKQSIVEDPEMLELRELLVYPMKNRFVVIAGNQRLAVCRELKFKETLCKILPADTSADKLKRYIIKDNIPYGDPDWDALANEWDETELIDWGLEIPFFDDKSKVEEINKTDEWVGMPEYEPGEKPIQINIYFRNDEDRERFIAKVPLKFTKQFEKESNTWSAWWPDRERRDIKSIKFVDEISDIHTDEGQV